SSLRFIIDSFLSMLFPSFPSLPVPSFAFRSVSSFSFLSFPSPFPALSFSPQKRFGGDVVDAAAALLVFARLRRRAAMLCGAGRRLQKRVPRQGNARTHGHRPHAHTLARCLLFVFPVRLLRGDFVCACDHYCRLSLLFAFSFVVVISFRLLLLRRRR